MIRLPESVQVVEVGPRDGLQSFPRPVDIDTKVKIVDRLSEVGFPVIEVTGFAHPKAIPNFADAEEVFERIARRPGIVYRALVPNATGAKRASAVRVDEMLGLMIMSPSYLSRNQNMTIEQALEHAAEAFRIADSVGAAYAAALGMSFWCPYEGITKEEDVIAALRYLRNAGVRRFYLAGSTGLEDAKHVNSLFTKAYDALPDIELGYHVHNLGGMGTANILAALDAGASWIEGAICGVGGGIAMPNSLGAVGNYPTEDLVRFLSLLGVQTGLDPEKVLAASLDVADLLQIEPRSHSALGITRERVRRSPSLAD